MTYDTIFLAVELYNMMLWLHSLDHDKEILQRDSVNLTLLTQYIQDPNTQFLQRLLAI